MSSRAIGNRKTAAEKRLSRQKKARIPMSCVVSVVGICSSDDGLKISPSQNAQTPSNEKHAGHGDPCLYLKFLNRFNTTVLS